MTRDAPPDEPEARVRSSSVSSAELRTIGTAARGGVFAYAMLVGVCQLLALIAFALVGAYGLWSWAKIGLLSASASLHADVIATLRGTAVLPGSGGSITLRWRFVPMLLTIGYLWLVARAGRRAARERQGRSAATTAALAAAGAAIPAAALAALAASLVRLSFPELGLSVRVDVPTAAVWSGIVTAAGAGAGAFLEAAGGRASARVLRGALGAYGWMLVLIAGAVVALATLEPDVTRAYVDGLRGLEAGGGVLFAAHLLAFPAQSAVLFVPAAGACLEVLGEGPAFHLCPWTLTASGPAGAILLPGPVRLSPWLWIVSAVPGIAAFLGGSRAADRDRRRSIARGATAGLLFGLLGATGAAFAAPRLAIPFLPLNVRVGIVAWMLGSVWGVAGGVLGGWLAGRRYGELGLPSPTSV